MTIETHPLESGTRLETLRWDNSSTVMVGMRCRQCDVSFRIPAFYYGLTRPPTIAFFHDNGIDYRTLELEYGSTAWDWESVALDDGVVIRFEVDGDRLEVELDSDLDLRSYQRTSLSDGR